MHMFFDRHILDQCHLQVTPPPPSTCPSSQIPNEYMQNPFPCLHPHPTPSCIYASKCIQTHSYRFLEQQPVHQKACAENQHSPQTLKFSAMASECNICRLVPLSFRPLPWDISGRWGVLLSSSLPCDGNSKSVCNVDELLWAVHAPVCVFTSS